MYLSTFERLQDQLGPDIERLMVERLDDEFDMAIVERAYDAIHQGNPWDEIFTNALIDFEELACGL